MDAVGGHDLGRGGSEVLGTEATVESHDDPAIRVAALLHPLGDPLRAHAHRVEGVGVRGPRPPAVGPELDVQTRAPSLTCVRQ